MLRSLHELLQGLGLGDLATDAGMAAALLRLLSALSHAEDNVLAALAQEVR